MGYTTEFVGNFQLNRPLFDFEVLYLLEFARTRRVKRSPTILATIPDPGRDAVGLPLGEEGGYFINELHPQAESSVLDDNRPPKGQPGLHCQWQPTSDGRGVEWDGHEKFYRYVEWLQYLIVHFFIPWNYQLNGTVSWQGETSSDKGQIVVVDNQIVQPQNAEAKLAVATSPISVPSSVWSGLHAIHTTDPTILVSWVATLRSCADLGYSDTAGWIEANLTGLYGVGIDRGFQDQETGEVFIPTYTIGFH
ncbi:hypothetical protein [Iningainema tapete]|uniref:Uncharacterized protein n=1 Tax=Iningainema tapete BLCC-T55 TaxID=2748662 RepID=A0A8J6XMR1_9CYAN|nr:hypothetical protein [Iningainema tapete]MBD2773826.1 hypothetical protein [Iningainema tapete BLCC-T55]